MECHVEGFRDGFFPYVGHDIKQCFEELKARCSPDLISLTTATIATRIIV